VEAVQDAQVTGLDGLLGEGHWKRCALASAALLGETPGAAAAVVFLSALSHDTMRLRDGYDPAHGWRAAWLTYDPEAFWRASELRHREEKRRANAALWYTHYSALASALRRSAEDYERRAERLLLEQPDRGEGCR
jgi:hypothetical protein